MTQQVITSREQYDALVKQKAPVETPDSSAGDYAKTAAQGFGAGALDAFTAIPRLATGAFSKAFGVKDPFARISGRGFLSDVAAVIEGPEAGSAYDEAQIERAHQNPTTATIGEVAGQVAGAAAGGLGGLARGAGAATTEALGGGVVARLLGAGAAGAVEGGPLGFAGASNEAYLQRQQLDWDHAIAATGLGALLGGGLRLGGKALAEGVGAARRGAQDFAESLVQKGSKATDEVANEAFDPSVYQGGGAVGPGSSAASAAVEAGANWAKSKAIHAAVDFLPVTGLGRAAVRMGLNAVADAGGGKLQELAAKAGTMAADAVESAAGPIKSAAGKLRPAAAAGSLSLFLGEHASPEAAFAARADELQGLAANNGADTRNKIVAALGPIASEQPGAIQAAQQTADRGIQYLLSKLPVPSIDSTSLTPMASKPRISRADALEFGQSWTAVYHPETTIASIARGTVVPDQMQALRLVYPTWATTIEQAAGVRLQRLDAEGVTLTERQRRTFDVVLSLDGASDALSTPAFVGRYGPRMSDAAQAGQKGQGGGGGRSGTSKIAANHMTQTDKLLGAGD